MVNDLKHKTTLKILMPKKRKELGFRLVSVLGVDTSRPSKHGCRKKVKSTLVQKKKTPKHLVTGFT